jgi:hypothetical protein
VASWTTYACDWCGTEGEERDASDGGAPEGWTVPDHGPLLCVACTSARREALAAVEKARRGGVGVAGEEAVPPELSRAYWKHAWESAIARENRVRELLAIPREQATDQWAAEVAAVASVRSSSAVDDTQVAILLTELRAAVQPLARIADEWEVDGLDESRPYWIKLLTLEDAMRARKAFLLCRDVLLVTRQRTIGEIAGDNQRREASKP